MARHPRPGLPRWSLSIAAALAMFVPGCVPVGSTRPIPPLAARMSGDQVQILYAGCDSKMTSKIRVTQPPKPWLEETDPVVWEVVFDPPVAQTQFVLGEVPPGGKEQVPLVAPLDPAANYTYFLTFSGGGEQQGGFKPERLADGAVAFQNRYMSAEEFASLTACTSAE